MNSTTRQLIVLIAVSICCSTSLLAEEVTVMISRPGAPLDSETQAVGGFPIAFGPFFGPGGPTLTVEIHAEEPLGCPGGANPPVCTAPCGPGPSVRRRVETTRVGAWAAGDVVIVRVHAPGSAEVCRCDLAAGHSCDVCCGARVFGYRGPFGTFAAAPGATNDYYEYQVGEHGPGCCLEGGLFCGHLDWQLCEIEGGVPSTQCLGDQDGDGIDDACHSAPIGACTSSNWCIEVSRDVCETLDFGEYQGDGTTCASECPADLNDDEIVSASDLAILLGSWGPCAECPADFDGDGVVGAADLAGLLGAWGLCAG